jgi:hypothetical protein
MRQSSVLKHNKELGQYKLDCHSKQCLVLLSVSECKLVRSNYHSQIIV